jgi:hypothetical protein
MLFDIPTLTDEEEDLILEVFSNLTVKKYLKIIAAEHSSDLLTSATLTEPPDALQRKHLFVSGKLSILNMLLGINKDV